MAFRELYNPQEFGAAEPSPEAGPAPKLDSAMVAEGEKNRHLQMFKSKPALALASLVSLLTSVGCSPGSMERGTAMYDASHNRSIVTTNITAGVGFNNAHPYKEFYVEKTIEPIGEQTPIYTTPKHNHHR